MSFQWIFDSAQSVSIDSRDFTAHTVTRSGIHRATTRGGQPWRFTVTLPNGAGWSDYRGLQASALELGRHTSDQIQLNTTGTDWYMAYQGDQTGTLTASWNLGATSFTVGGASDPGYTVRAGDLVQLGDYVYMVTRDVIAGASSTIHIHRPTITGGTTTNMKLGGDCVFTVRCTSFPTYGPIARNQIGWDAPFEFTEVIE